MLNCIQLILTPIVCFEMRLECEISCQNVNSDDKTKESQCEAGAQIWCLSRSFYVARDRIIFGDVICPLFH